VYIESLYNYSHDFRRAVKCATMKVKFAIEDGQSLKLHQTSDFSSTASIKQPRTRFTQPASSIATVMTDVFQKKLNYNVIKIAKTVRIFMEIEHIKNWGLAQKNWTTISYTMEWSRVWSKSVLKN